MVRTIAIWKILDYIRIQHYNYIRINVRKENLLGHGVKSYEYA